MTLQGVLQGAQVSENARWNRAIHIGLEFYLDRMFDRWRRPKITPDRTFPIDVMSCAEGIILLTGALSAPRPLPGSLRERMVERLEGLASWTCSNLQRPSGDFYYQVYGPFRFALGSYRWGQGAMLKALAAYLTYGQ
jgi:hypothetical protein